MTTVSHASDAARPCFSSEATATLSGAAAARMLKARRALPRGERRRSGPAAEKARWDVGGARNAGSRFQASVPSRFHSCKPSRGFLPAAHPASMLTAPWRAARRKTGREVGCARNAEAQAADHTAAAAHLARPRIFRKYVFPSGNTYFFLLW